MSNSTKPRGKAPAKGTKVVVGSSSATRKGLAKSPKAKGGTSV